MADKQRLIYTDKFWDRLIKSRYDFFTYPDGRCGYSLGTISDVLWRTKSVDAVEVVRCKDCKHMKIDRNGYRWCLVWTGINGMGDEGFCNYGERKDNERKAD